MLRSMVETFDDIKTYENVRKFATCQGDDYTIVFY